MFLKKSYKSLDAFYNAVAQLVALCRIHGFETEAKAVDGILHGAWTTSSELIGELMLCFETIDGNLPKDLKKLKDDCRYFARHHRKILGLR
ncbi:MAG: hypothetical protein ABIL58_09500 [Pseudomonadota bacterium]